LRRTSAPWPNHHDKHRAKHGGWRKAHGIVCVAVPVRADRIKCGKMTTLSTGSQWLMFQKGKVAD